MALTAHYLSKGDAEMPDRFPRDQLNYQVHSGMAALMLVQKVRAQLTVRSSGSNVGQHS